MVIQKSILLWSPNSQVNKALKELIESDEEFTVDDFQQDLTAEQLAENYSAFIGHMEHASDIDSMVYSTKSVMAGLKDLPCIFLAPKSFKVEISFFDPQRALKIEMPFKFREFKAQLLRLISEFEHDQMTEFYIGETMVNPQRSYCLNQSGYSIKLTKMELSLLMCLRHANGRVLSREYLLQKVWGYNSTIVTKTLDTHIHWLRQKIEPNPNTPQYLMTEDGGYCLSLSTK